MAEYSRCPNCGYEGGGSIFEYVSIYQCRKCGRVFCSKCAGGIKLIIWDLKVKCPFCGDDGGLFGPKILGSIEQR